MIQLDLFSEVPGLPTPAEYMAHIFIKDHEPEIREIVLQEKTTEAVAKRLKRLIIPYGFSGAYGWPDPYKGYDARPENVTVYISSLTDKAVVTWDAIAFEVKREEWRFWLNEREPAEHENQR